MIMFIAVVCIVIGTFVILFAGTFIKFGIIAKNEDHEAWEGIGALILIFGLSIIVIISGIKAIIYYWPFR